MAWDKLLLFTGGELLFSLAPGPTVVMISAYGFRGGFRDALAAICGTQTGRLDVGDVLLYAGLIFWTLGYDTIYAHQDKDDDELIGVKSTARLFGKNTSKWVLRFYAIAFTLILACGFTEHTGWPFAFVLLAAGAHLLWQVRTLDIASADNCLAVFRANRETGALIALAFLLASWFG